MKEFILNLFTEKEIVEYLKKKGYIVEKKDKRAEIIKRAREQRTEEIKRKIEKAIQELKQQGKDINTHSVSKQAEVNYRTAKKYLDELK